MRYRYVGPVPSRTITYDLIIFENIRYTSVWFLVDQDPDPDLHGSTLILFGWIRIQEGKNYSERAEDFAWPWIRIQCRLDLKFWIRIRMESGFTALKYHIRLIDIFFSLKTYGTVKSRRCSFQSFLFISFPTIYLDFPLFLTSSPSSLLFFVPVLLYMFIVHRLQLIGFIG
jgi:hypothetical protein